MTLQKLKIILFELIILLSTVLFAVADPKAVSVQIRSAKIRSAPQQFASSVESVKFGDSLVVISSDAGWLKVRSSTGVEGYLHEGAVTLKKIILSSRQVSLTDVAVDEDQVYLAGKGFNSEVEKLFRKEKSKADYSAVDALQKTSIVTEEQVKRFISEGKLSEN